MTAALGLFLAHAAAPRLALVVAVDAYSFVSPAVSPDLRLSGAKNDLEAMQGLLRDAGFTARPLFQGQATRAAIEKALEVLADGAQAGSDVCFYFSGRGAATGAGEPTLVAADGAKADASHDVPMSKVEAMAKRATDKGAHVTVVIDACFSPGFKSRDALESRIYKPERRVWARTGAKVRSDLYRGPGVFLCPALANGAAYEWRLTGDSTSWTGAFTDYLVGVGDDALLTRRLPPVRAMMREASAYFRARVRQSYLPDMHVGLPEKNDDPGYDAAFLVSGDLAPLPPDRERMARMRTDALQAAARTLRVALRVADAVPEAQRDDLQKRLIDFKGPLEAVPGVRLAAMGEPGIDRVVDVAGTNGLTLTVQGGPLTKRAQAGFSGAAPTDVLAAGLGTYLRRELLVKRLWNVASDRPESPAWAPKMVSRTIAPGQPVAFRFTNAAGGYLYALTRDEGEAEIGLAFPNLLEEESYFAPGDHEAPARFKNAPTATEGRSDYLVVFVPAAKGDLPPLPKYAGGGSAAGSRAFDEPLAEHLDALLKRLEAPGAAFEAKRLEYEIPPKS